MFDKLFRDRDFVEPKDLAALGIMSKTTQWEERKSGRLPHLRVGEKKILYTEQHLLDYFENNSNHAASAA